MSSTAPRAAPLALWRIVQSYLHTLYNLFGAPEDVAAEHTLTAKAHALLSLWLQAGEAMLRRLLLIEANAVALGPPASSRPKNKREPKLISFAANQPDSWRVSFRCWDRRLPAGKPVQPAHAEQTEPPRRLEAGGPKRFHSAWPLAERYEALIRVFNNPAPYARRLARRLSANPRGAARAGALPRAIASVLPPDEIAAFNAVNPAAAPLKPD